MRAPPDSSVANPGDLPSAFRQIRRLRGLSTRAVAEAMDLNLRNYQQIEKSGYAAKREHLRRFAEVTDSDLMALAVSELLASPRLALRCADNKLVTWLLMGLADLEAELGDEMRQLDAAFVLSEFDEAYRNIAAYARKRAARASKSDLELFDLRLTKRQIECLQWAQAGKSSSDIGQILGISQRTVDEHIGEACARLGVRTRVQAVAVAHQLDLLGGSTP